MKGHCRETVVVFVVCLFVFFPYFGVFLQRFNTPNPKSLDNTRLETSVVRVKETLEINKRHGNSRQNFATEEETFLNCREILVGFSKVLINFNIELTLPCLFFQTVAKFSNLQCRFL